jgi:hypothetical protein
MQDARVVSDGLAVDDGDGSRLRCALLAGVDSRFVVITLVVKITVDGVDVRNHHPVREVGIEKNMTAHTEDDEAVFTGEVGEWEDIEGF